MMLDINHSLVRLITRAVRRYLVGPDQRWTFEPPPDEWSPLPVERTSLYLHVPFCANRCPYCPYTKVAFDQALLAPYREAALAEVNWWADRIGPAEVTSIYIGGGTPTLALDCVTAVLAHMRARFRVTGDVCIETNPADVDALTADGLHRAGVDLVSLGVQSFDRRNLQLLGRGYGPDVAEHALTLLGQSDFASVNADLIFALPDQTPADVTIDLAHAAHLGADQVTTYPLFTFPYTAVGEYLQLKTLRMPNLHRRRQHYRAISRWCDDHGFARVSVWGFKRGSVPRYSSVTRDGYIGIGPGAGSHLSGGFILNTFDVDSWIAALSAGRPAVALRLPFTDAMSAWWWFYWRLYDTRFATSNLESVMGGQAPRARRWLQVVARLGLAAHRDGILELTEPGAFWLHLAQNYFALNYVNTLWTGARREPWPQAIPL